MEEIYEEMRKYLVIYEEIISHIYMTLQLLHSEFPYIWEIFDYWDTGSELYVFIGQLLKLNWLYTELGDFLPVHYTPIFTPQTVGGFINNILAHHD